MSIFMTGDTHGDFSRLRPAAFREQGGLTKDDYCCRSFGHYRDNRMSKASPSCGSCRSAKIPTGRQ